MSTTRAARLLWCGALLLAPLPYLAPLAGLVPVVRFVFLGAVAAGYAAFVDGSGTAWIVVALLLGQALVYALALRIAAGWIARRVPARLRAPLVWGLLVAGLAIACSFELYRTPFDDASPRARWTGLFQ